jgi:hypothetical protein
VNNVIDLEIIQRGNHARRSYLRICIIGDNNIKWWDVSHARRAYLRICIIGDDNIKWWGVCHARRA